MLAFTVGSIGFVVGGGILVAVGVYTWWRSRLGPSPPGAECLRASVADVALGGAVRLGSFGDEGEDVELTIARRARVRLGPDEWLELSGDYRGRTLAIEWGKKRVVAYKRTGVTLDALGLALDQVDALAPGASLPLGESTLRLEEKGDAIREGAGDSVASRTWGLHEEVKRRFVRIEKVGERPAVASDGILVASDALEIVRLGGRPA